MRSKIAIFLGVAAAVIAAACALFRKTSAPARPFNHEAHLERGLDCFACHADADKLDGAGMPSKDLCMGCHEEIDKEPGRAKEKTVAWFLDERGDPQWSSFTKQGGDIKFSHKAHAARRIDCMACHSGMDKSKGLVAEPVQSMRSCMECHEKDAPAATACATCHTTIDRDRAPATHARMWGKLHGACSREGGTANDCAMCHQRDECVTCHQTKAPDDHTQFWRLRAHGIAAGTDRSRCQTCHASDSCDRCHQESAPRNHLAGWNSPTNGHCGSCHVPLQTSGSCFVCHKSTPGHASAAPKPAWHNAAMNCRSCHAASLPHIDNGDNCNACHR
jgi:hypothetical protein